MSNGPFSSMARPLRLEFPGALYHVTSRGNAREAIVADDVDRANWATVLAQAVERFNWRLHAYCLMDNHYHLLLETPQPNLARGMRHLNGVYTQTFNRRHHRVGHLFQGRYQAILVEKDAHLLELSRYVVLNPVRAKMVAHPRRWAWSSYRATAGDTNCPPFLTTDWIWAQFGSRISSAQTRYRQFVAEGKGGPRPWEQVQGQIYLGSGAFIARHQPDRLIAEVPRRQTQAQRPELAHLFPGGKRTPTRLLTATRRHGYRLAEMAAHFGVHYATVSRWIKQAEQGRA